MDVAFIKIEFVDQGRGYRVKREGQVNPGPGGVRELETEVMEAKGEAATDGRLSGFGRKSFHWKQLQKV